MNNLNKLFLSQLILLIGFLLPTSSQATVHTLDLALSGQFEVPANASNATGTLIGTYDDVTNMLSFTLRFNGLSAPAAAGHFHGPAAAGTNAPVVIPFGGFPTGVTSGVYSNTYTLTPFQESQLLCGMWYVNIHNSIYPGGELRSQVKESPSSGSIRHFELAMSGLKEVPANASTATGTLIGDFNTVTNVLSFTLRFNGLAAPTSAGHFHASALPGANAPVVIPFAGFPVGVTSGFYSNTYTLTPSQAASLLAGQMYVNIHNATYPGGELRSQVTEGSMIGNCAGVPTMSEWSILIVCLISLSIGMIFIYRKQYSLVHANSDKRTHFRAPFFYPSLFTKLLAVYTALAVAGLFLSYLYFGSLTLTDTLGTLICAAIVAFMTQLVMGAKSQDN